MKYNRTYWLFLLAFILLFFEGCNHRSSISDLKSINNYSEIKKLRKDADKKFDDSSYVEATILYSKLIEVDSLNGEFYYKRAYSQAHINDYESAVKNFKKSSELEYRLYDSYYNLGIIYMIIFLDDSTATHYFEKALEIMPNSEQVPSMLEVIKENRK